MLAVGYISGMGFSFRVNCVLTAWALAMLCALLLALAALALINRLIYNPAGQVNQYFAAVREGNGERALGILGATVPESNGAMLDGDALSGSLKDLHDLKVAETVVNEDGSHATVTVSYTVNDTAQTTDFHLSKVGSHWGVFDQWHINPVELPTVRVSSPVVSAATLNQEKVAVDDGARGFAVTYPGYYTATYESALYTAEQQSAVITSADQHTQDLSIKLTPSEAAQNSITYQIKSQLDECATQNSLYPAGCPFEYNFDGRVQGDVKWTIEKYPGPKASFDAKGKWVLSDSAGEAKISFTQLDLYTGKTSQVNETVKFTYSATLETTDTEVTVKPTFP